MSYLGSLKRHMARTAIAGGLVLTLGLGFAVAQSQPSSDQILNSLTPKRTTRSLSLSPAEQAKQAQAHVVGLSILSGSHVSLVREVVQRLREAGLGDVPVVVGGIIPPDDVNILKQCGASAIYTPKDFQLNDIMAGIVQLVDAKAEALVKQSVPVPPLRQREKVPLR